MRLIGHLWLLAVVCLVGIVAELVGIHQQTPVQRGIDAHTVTVTGTYTELIKGRTKLSDDTYVLTYGYEDRLIRATVRSLPGSPAPGDTLCLEIDATHPDHARVCGTHGGLDDARQGLVIGVTALSVILVIMAVSTLLGQRRRETGIVAETFAAFDPPAPVIGTEMLLRAAPATRWTMVLSFPCVLVMLAWWPLADPTVAYRGPLATLLLALTAVLAARCWRVGVRCTPETVTVRGVLITRRVPAVQVTGVEDADCLTECPTLHWRDPSGRYHRCRLRYFGTGERSLGSVSRYHLAQLARLRAWLAANRTAADAAKPAPAA